MSDNEQGTTLRFLDNCLPPLQDGNYRLRVTQTVTDGSNELFSNTAIQTFTIAGERYRLPEQEILAVFPPPDSTGDHSNVLPHVVLRRSTLPWERSASVDPVDPNKTDTPWLAILLFDEEEAPAPKTVDLKTLFQPPAGVSFPDRTMLEREPDERDEDRVTIIDVPAELLHQIAPTDDELRWLAHVRQLMDDAKNVLGVQAVVMGNRLGRPGRTSVAHLVSMESRYPLPTSKDAESVRLVSLKSWRYACLDEKKSFMNLLLELDQDRMQLPAAAIQPAANFQDDPSLIYLLDQYRQEGFTLLPHHLRNGGRTLSWYRSPLCSRWRAIDLFDLPVQTADALLVHDERTDMFDISYAAAWELGRLLTLQNTDIALALYHWKRAHACHSRELQRQLDHLPYASAAPSADLPENVAAWFRGLSLLDGVPFSYLVPDQRMLPPESIRFFQVDPLWTACLLDGAFAIGRVLDSDYSRDQRHYDADSSLHAKVSYAETGESPAQLISGFLLRSEVVAGWPHLQVAALDYLQNLPEVAPLRMERLSKDVLLCLFDDVLMGTDSVRIHQKPEGLHAGISEPDEKHKFFFKSRRATGENAGNEDKPTDIVDVPFRRKDGSVNAKTIPLDRVLDINALAAKLCDPSEGSGSFALQMVEGVSQVEFSFYPRA